MWSRKKRPIDQYEPKPILFSFKFNLKEKIFSKRNQQTSQRVDNLSLWCCKRLVDDSNSFYVYRAARKMHGEGGDDEFWMFSYGLIRLTGHQFSLIDLLKYYYKQFFVPSLTFTKSTRRIMILFNDFIFRGRVWISSNHHRSMTLVRTLCVFIL